MSAAPAVRKRLSPIAGLTRFWADDKGLSIFSILLFVVIFVLPVALPVGSGRRPAGAVAYALLLVSGVLALGEQRLARAVLLPIALLTLAVELASWLVRVPDVWVEGMSLLSLIAFLIVVLGQTLRAGPVTWHRIQGAIAAYLLLGVIWANAYSLL